MPAPKKLDWEEKTTSSVLWKGYNKQLQLDMTIIFVGVDDKLIYTVVKLTVPGTGEEEASVTAQWHKETMQGAIESGDFETMINTCYINTQMTAFQDYLLQERKVN
jgi:hypothetical protein